MFYIFSGKKQESSQIEQKLEIVFIVQEHKSLINPEMKTSVYQGMESMLNALDDKFKANGYSTVQFSLVGFGRKGALYRPTVHSSKKYVWFKMIFLTNKNYDGGNIFCGFKYLLTIIL